MELQGAIVFAVAGSITLLSIVPLRRLAMAVGFYDQPGVRKIHADPIPYLGGIGIMIGVLGGLLAALLLAPWPSTPVLAVVLIAVVFGVVGLYDDAFPLPPELRLLGQVAAAVAIVGLGGIRFELTGVALVDGVLAVVWIVAMINAVNNLDNMDGLSAGISYTVAVGLALIALVVTSPVLLTLSAALAGALLGYLAHNVPPARIFMGDAGSMFVGFLIAVLTLTPVTELSAPEPAAVALLLMGVPVLDTVTVFVARALIGRNPLHGGKDHLSHRLQPRFGRGGAVAFLVVANALLVALALAVVLETLSTAIGLLAGGALLLVVGLLTWPVDPYGDWVQAEREHARENTVPDEPS